MFTAYQCVSQSARQRRDMTSEDLQMVCLLESHFERRSKESVFCTVPSAGLGVPVSAVQSEYGS